MEELEFWQAGHYGPICKGRLKKRDGASSAVVVKSLRGTQLIYQRNDLESTMLSRSIFFVKRTTKFSLDDPSKTGVKTQVKKRF